MKIVKLLVIASVVTTVCHGYVQMLGGPDLLATTLIKLLSSRDPVMLNQNRAQTLTSIGTGPIMETVLRALSPTAAYAFYTLDRNDAILLNPQDYWSQVLLAEFEETEIRQQLPLVFARHAWLRPQHIILTIRLQLLAVNIRILDYMNAWFAAHKIYNVIFVYHNYGDVIVYTSEPFLPSGPRRQLNFSKYNNLFYDKTRDLHGHELSVVLFPDMPRAVFGSGAYAGIDGEHMTTLLAKINATFRVESMPDTFQRFDVVFNMLPIVWTRQSYTYPYEVEELCFIVKRGPRQFLASHLATLFQIRTWWVIFTIFAVCMSLWQVYHHNEPMADTLYFMVQAQAQQSIREHARTMFENVFVYSFSLYACLIIMMIRARIYALVIAPGIEVPVKTMSEVLTSNDEIFTSEWVYESLEHMYGHAFVRPFYTFDREFLFNYSTTASAFLLPKWEAQQIVRQPQNIYNSKNTMWYVVPDCLHAWPRSYALEPGSPFVAVFNQYMLWMREMGMVQGMALAYHWPTVGSPEKFDKTTIDISAWQFRHAYFMVGTGLGVAAVVFVLEVLCSRIQGWWRRRTMDHLPLLQFLE